MHEWKKRLVLRKKHSTEKGEEEIIKVEVTVTMTI